jgi:hypothetical protein
MKMTQVGPAATTDVLMTAWHTASDRAARDGDEDDFTDIEVIGPNIELWVDSDIPRWKESAGEIALGRVLLEMESGWKVGVPFVRRNR